MRKTITIELPEQKTRWCPDPHRRGRIIKSKRLYKRRPRTQDRDR